jgi:hypothetical protein
LSLSLSFSRSDWSMEKSLEDDILARRVECGRGNWWCNQAMGRPDTRRMDVGRWW